MIEPVAHGTYQQRLGGLVIIQMLHDLEVLQLRIPLNGQAVVCQSGLIYLMVGSNEKLVLRPLANECDFLLDGAFQTDECLVGRVVDVLGIPCAQPQAVLLVHTDMCQGDSSGGVDAVCKIQFQVVFVRIGIVFEDVPVLSQHPNASCIVHMNVGHVREMLDGLVFIVQFIVYVLLPVVSVHSFVSKKPHVSFGILLDGNHPSAAQPVFRFQISIKLCGGGKCSP